MEGRQQQDTPSSFGEVLDARLYLCVPQFIKSIARSEFSPK